MSARNPRRVSSPCSFLSSKAYSHSLLHTHTPLILSLSLMHPLTRYLSLPILLKFLSLLTQHLFPIEDMKFPSVARETGWISDWLWTFSFTNTLHTRFLLLNVRLLCLCCSFLFVVFVFLTSLSCNIVLHYMKFVSFLFLCACISF